MLSTTFKLSTVLDCKVSLVLMLSTTLRLSAAFSFSVGRSDTFSVLSLKFSTSVICRPAVFIALTPPSSTSEVLDCKFSFVFMLSTTLRLSTAFSFSVGRSDTFSVPLFKLSTSVICKPALVFDLTPPSNSSTSLKLFATTCRLFSGLIFSSAGGISEGIIFTSFSTTGFVESFSFPCNP